MLALTITNRHRTAFVYETFLEGRLQNHIKRAVAIPLTRVPSEHTPLFNAYAHLLVRQLTYVPTVRGGAANSVTAPYQHTFDGLSLPLDAGAR